MAYSYKKLTDVALVETAETPNILIEEGGDIKKFLPQILLLHKLKQIGKKQIQTVLHLF